MPRIINWELAKNPANWLIVYLMVSFAVLLFTLIDPLRVETRRNSGEWD